MKLANILQDLSKLKKLGFTFILKFTENAKPLVKVGGGYLTLEQFILYILEKIHKSNATTSPANSHISNIDSGLVERLNIYLTEMNNLNLRKAEHYRGESFQGRMFTDNKSSGNRISPRGNFMKAVVEKVDPAQKKGLGSPLNGLNSKKIMQLTEGFTINVRGNNKV